MITYEYRHAHTPWWHWPLVPFAAVAAASIAAMVLIALRWAGMTVIGDPQAASAGLGHESVVVLALVAGYFYAWGAIRFAPNGSRLVGIGMTTILAAVLMLKSIAGWFHPETALADPMALVLGSAAAVIGAVIALFTVRD